MTTDHRLSAKAHVDALIAMLRSDSAKDQLQPVVVECEALSRAIARVSHRRHSLPDVQRRSLVDPRRPRRAGRAPRPCLPTFAASSRLRGSIPVRTRRHPPREDDRRDRELRRRRKAGRASSRQTSASAAGSRTVRRNGPTIASSCSCWRSAAAATSRLWPGISHSPRVAGVLYEDLNDPLGIAVADAGPGSQSLRGCGPAGAHAADRSNLSCRNPTTRCSAGPTRSVTNPTSARRWSIGHGGRCSTRHGAGRTWYPLRRSGRFSQLDAGRAAHHPRRARRHRHDLRRRRSGARRPARLSRPRPRRQRLRDRPHRQGAVSPVGGRAGHAQDAADLALPRSPGAVLRRPGDLAVRKRNGGRESPRAAWICNTFQQHGQRLSRRLVAWDQGPVAGRPRSARTGRDGRDLGRGTPLGSRRPGAARQSSGLHDGHDDARPPLQEGARPPQARRPRLHLHRRPRTPRARGDDDDRPRQRDAGGRTGGDSPVPLEPRRCGRG